MSGATMSGARWFHRKRPMSNEWHDDPWDDTELTMATVVERPRRSFRPLRFVVYLALMVGLAGVIAAGSVAFWYVRKINPEGEATEAVNFTVNANDTLETLSVRLQDDGFVSDANVFRWYVGKQGGLELTPGYYQLRHGDHMGNIMRVLRTPPEQTYTKVTFPEGFTLAKMADRLNEKVPRLSVRNYLEAASDGSIRSVYSPAGENSLEGLLFPDTYQVSNGESVTRLLLRQVELMERVGRQEQIVEKGYALKLNAYQVLIIASMVEREAKVDADRPMIARVILNRIEKGMPLQIDATLFYGQDPTLSVGRLKLIDSPYNTYMYAGLPPTPIANPGRASINAVVNPAVDPPEGGAICKGLAKGDCHWYYYVLADTDGRHAFAVTLEQHQANVDIARAAGLL